MTFSEGLRQWTIAKSLGKKPRTAQFYQELYRAILESWSDASVPVTEITADMVLEFAQKFTGQCPSRWNAMLSAIRSLTPHGKLLPRRALRVRHFTPPNQTEFESFLRECDNTPRSKAGLVVRFLCFTGLRISEARALVWKNILTDHIDVPAEITKNGRARSIPLLPGVEDVLKRLKAISKSDFVLPRQNARKAIERASARVFGEQWSFHSCRHFFATRCIQSGVDIPTVARWLGHSDGGALLSKTYFHLADDHSRAMAAKVSITPAAQLAPTIPAGAPQVPAHYYALTTLTHFQVVTA